MPDGKKGDEKKKRENFSRNMMSIAIPSFKKSDLSTKGLAKKTIFWWEHNYVSFKLVSRSEYVIR